ncbi:Tim44 domain-containing protein [Marinivivus vitaminiproducens]|uniref:Tim44 domain-containing protein n=1 Tax=Marinivivus vitaminiproducens TaxID=3035935 RepID=UPI0027A03EF1|nr:TIM44-like domain-containing protein [Geminicoccaceae bacterium SCSIO 64248]
MSLKPSRSRRVLAVLATALILAASTADARPGRGGFGGMGSRGARTYQAPPPTQTAPGQVGPLQRSTTPNTPGMNQATPGAASTVGRGGLFGQRGGFMGGLLGAGLIGAFLGYGLFGGLGGGFASILGLLLQIVLIVVIARFAIRAFQRRSQPVPAGAAQGAGGPSLRDAIPPVGGYGQRPATGGGIPAGGGSARIEAGDFDAFERLLGEIQTAYGEEDIGRLRTLATPEMVDYLSEELSENVSRGVVNRIDQVKLLQGDLAEAWTERGTTYATVAMRYALVDVTVERNSGTVVEGEPDRPVEVTELWTFLRASGGRWLLSAIQPA